MLEFLVDVDTANREDLILSLGEQVFQFALEERVYRLGIMLKGGGSFTDMSRSPLAVFESEATHAPLKNKAMKRLFNQPITTSTTPDMKDLMKTEAAKLANAVHPEAREAVRITPRQENPILPIDMVTIVHDAVVADSSQSSMDLFREGIDQANIAKRKFLAVVNCLSRVVMRLYRKSRSFQQAKADVSGEYYGTRGRAIANWVQGKEGKGILVRPAVLLFREDCEDDLGSILSRTKLHLGNVIEVLIYHVVGNASRSFSDLCTLGNVYVVCKSSKNRGSFGGKSRMDIGALYHLLSEKV